MDGRKWISNISCSGDHDGEMFQALFSGSGGWCSVIIPFKKYLLTSRGVPIEQDHKLEPTKIATMGLLQAEKKEGEFKIQLDSIRALSLERMSVHVRYDPAAGCDEEEEKIVRSPKSYYSGVFRY